jgi:hypothetical protein
MAFSFAWFAVGRMPTRLRGYASIMQRHDDELRSELGQTLALFGMAVVLVLAVLLAGIGL